MPAKATSVPRTRRKTIKAQSRKTPAAQPAKARVISDASVEKATGKPSDHWFKVLDAFAKKQSGHDHKNAAAFLHAEHGVPEWWCQMVTVLYERERGHRATHERPDGFSVSVSRTMGVPIAELYRAWTGEVRRKWLDEEFAVRKATQNRSIRITWSDGSNVEVMFYPKGEAKAQVVVQHSKLKSAAAGVRVKKAWAGRLDALRETLER
jgi:hypothetical protein